MTWRTHAVVGANAVWITAFFSSVDATAFGLLVAGAFAGLLPDIDASARGAKIHYVAEGTFGMFKGVFQHRGFFHSLLAVATVFLLSFWFLRAYHPFLPAILALGYASHPIIDGFNTVGVRYLFPKRERYNLIPKLFRTPVHGFADQLFFIAGSLGIALFVLSYAVNFSFSFGTIAL
ncbi:metal-dependent hydrolase [Candidatus Uhrbacteria bacterium]|nr:metal-dependent hydrolase [Candidatus Uhrbacteria bacterium]